MDISIQNLGKKYSGSNWIFRKLNFEISSGDCLAITGNNGSGKSTFMKIVAGSVLPSEGIVTYGKEKGDEPLEKISFTAPYLELIQEFTIQEQVRFHFKFRALDNCESTDALIQKMYLESHQHKLVKSLSSGMQQRLKIGLALHTAADLYLIDEPTTNMDTQGISWYQDVIQELKNKHTLLVASNQAHEYEMCDKILEIKASF